jgi:hypothetical protein
VTPTAVGSGPGAGLGLSTADLSPFDTNSGVTVVNKPLVGAPTPNATYYKGPGGAVVTSPSEPVLPLVTKNVTSTTAGQTFRGVGFRGGTYTDTSGITPLVTDPATELNTPHTPFLSTNFHPISLATGNYFDAFAGGKTRLLVTPVQHRVDTGATTSTLRRFTNLDLRLFYTTNTGPASRSAPPSILDVTAAPTAATST